MDNGIIKRLCDEAQMCVNIAYFENRINLKAKDYICNLLYLSFKNLDLRKETDGTLVEFACKGEEQC